MTPKKCTINVRCKCEAVVLFIRLRAASLFLSDLVKGVHAHPSVERRSRVTRETRALPSRAFSHARGHLRVSGVLLDGPRKRETARRLFAHKTYYFFDVLFSYHCRPRSDRKFVKMINSIPDKVWSGFSTLMLSSGLTSHETELVLSGTISDS